MRGTLAVAVILLLSLTHLFAYTKGREAENAAQLRADNALLQKRIERMVEISQQDAARARIDRQILSELDDEIKEILNEMEDADARALGESHVDSLRRAWRQLD
jgi:parvulin-like peptidyl-prolyl isomerase